MGLVVGAGGEEQRSSARCSGWPLPNWIAHRPSIAIGLWSAFLSTPRWCLAPVGMLPEGVDLAVAEVADQEVAAEPAEVRRCESEAPRRIQLAAGRDAPEEVAAHVEDVHEPEALPATSSSGSSSSCFA